MFNFSLERTLLTLPGIIIGLSFHEFAHAYMANHYGDPTAKNEGRLTLNPLAHLDPLGAIMIIFFGIGWGKPVPVNSYRLTRKEDMMVSLAGPVSNFILAILLSFVFKILLIAGFNNIILMKMLYFSIWINVILGLFNLLPVYPLDGSHILANILPDKLARQYSGFMERGGFQMQIILILMVFLFAGIIIIPVGRLIMGLLGLPH